ncbi:Quinolinate phosphoribosyl transferase [Dehalogenimonas lykanthroporepellens BL-DC-9]|jgi:nicotinate phosphoribosyltransferase|nr:Quinolinate phosphoribosyl transferase [Dehalogenimonas lykanthroporepellens BL-DC-9]
MKNKPERFVPAESVLRGDTADVYFRRAVDILSAEGRDAVVTMEFFPNGDGVLCGLEEALTLLERALPPDNREVWALTDGDRVASKEVALRVRAPYLSFGLYETALCGILATGTGWATAARQCAEAAGDIPCISFGARHVHPLVAGRMDYAAVTGGCRGCSSIEGARLAGIEPSGTMPHALIIVIGDTVEATLAFDRHIDPAVSRVALVDTFKDEAEESLRVATALGEKLKAVRLDTPVERGRVTAELVTEVRARLDQAGHGHVGVFVSGGITPERIRYFLDHGAAVTGFGIGSHISGARPIDFTADIHEVDGAAVAKRGRIPGITENPRLRRVL